jgi:hypothetical protein
LRRDGVIMKLEFGLMGSSRFGGQRNNWLHKCLWFNNKRNEHLCLYPFWRRLGTDADIRRNAR